MSPTLISLCFCWLKGPWKETERLSNTLQKHHAHKRTVGDHLSTSITNHTHSYDPLSHAPSTVLHLLAWQLCTCQHAQPLPLQISTQFAFLSRNWLSEKVRTWLISAWNANDSLSAMTAWSVVFFSLDEGFESAVCCPASELIRNFGWWRLLTEYIIDSASLYVMII